MSVRDARRAATVLRGLFGATGPACGDDGRGPVLTGRA
jgi:hypothetical protein